MQKPDTHQKNPLPKNTLTASGLHKVDGPGDGKVVSRIRAQVAGQAILDEEVWEATYHRIHEFFNLPEPHRSKRRQEVYDEELEKIIDREVILAEAFSQMSKIRPQHIEKLKEAAAREFDRRVKAMKEHLPNKSDEEFKAILSQQGLTVDGIRRQVERSFMQMEYMRSRIYPFIEKGVTHQAIKEYYDQHQDEFRVEDRVIWQDIFIPVQRYPNRQAARQAAEAIARQARNGADFIALAKEHDPDSFAFRQGEGLGQRRGEIQPPEAEPILFNMREGDVGPLIEMTNGFHIIRVHKRDYAGIQPLDDDAQEMIRAKLQNIIGAREYKRILSELKSKWHVERDPRP
ncbi:MAG: peptidylprolyl isomerase [Gemmataceae bacterium]